MSANYEYTTADLAAIRRAIARGEQTVQFRDRSVTYRSVKDLLEIESRIAAALEGRPKQIAIVPGSR